MFGVEVYLPEVKKYEAVIKKSNQKISQASMLLPQVKKYEAVI